MFRIRDIETELFSDKKLPYVIMSIVRNKES